jgi:hypothetical protein
MLSCPINLCSAHWCSPLPHVYAQLLLGTVLLNFHDLDKCKCRNSWPAGKTFLASKREAPSPNTAAGHATLHLVELWIHHLATVTLTTGHR